MSDPSPPGLCATFFLAIPGYLLLGAIGTHDVAAFWISFLTVFAGSRITILSLHRRSRTAQHQAVPRAAVRRVDPTGERRFWRDS